MSTLSELLPSGGGGSTVDFVASGTLPNGKPVVLKSDGTVEVVVGTSTSVAENIPAGAEYIFNSGSTVYISTSFDPNTTGKFVVAYRDVSNSGYGTVVVGTISGTTISFGSEYVFSLAVTNELSISFDPNTANKFIVSYQDNGNLDYGTVIVGTVSGTAISFGSKYIFNSGSTNYTSTSFDPNTTGMFVVAYRDSGNSNYGTAIVGTVSGTTISFGSEYTFSASTTTLTTVSFDPNTANKFVVAYGAGNGSNGKAIVGTVSGTTISFGSEYASSSGSAYHISASFDPNTAGKFVVSYRDAGNLNYGTTVAGTISGTTISFGSAVVFNSGITSFTSTSFDPNTANKFVVSYQDNGNSNYGKVVVGTVSGTAISFGSEITLNSDFTDYISASFDPNSAGKFVVAYRDNGNSNYGTAIVGQIATTITTTNLTSTNFVGTSTAAYTNGQTATIAIQGGLSTNQTGLTIGSTYYVQEDGTFATTADTISVNAGKALSATTLLLKDL